MFSKSSECNIAIPSEYLCTETCETQEGYGTSPFCAAMGQPLIYYCLTPHQTYKQRSANVPRDNRNFFAKAFHWYTEEHVPHRDECAKKTADVKGFANWLDSKYDQFVDDQCDSCGYKVKHTSITEAYRFQNEPCETRRKKFRVKSPWRKKRGHKDTGDVTSKCSLHYIMKPKDISRPASETNDMSKAMMMSSDVVLSRYSHSCTSLRILREPSVAVAKKTQDAAQSTNSMKLNKNATKSLSKMSPEEPKDVICLCSKVPKKNMSTQSDPWPVKSPLKNAPKKVETHSQTWPHKSSSKSVPKVETHCQTWPHKSSSKSVPKVETHCQTCTKSESPLQPAQNAAECLCRPSKFTKISHPTKIEIEFEAKPSSTRMESSKCQVSEELIPKADALSQFQTDVMTCACGSDHSITQEKIQIAPNNLRQHPCKCEHKDYEKCPLEPPLTKPNQNQPFHCNQCVPCKKTTIVTDDGKNKVMPGPNGLASNPSNKTTPSPNGLASNPSNKATPSPNGLASNPSNKATPSPNGLASNPSNKTTPSPNGLASNPSNKTTPSPNGLGTNPSNKKTTGADSIPAAIPTTTNDGAQTSNQTTIANDGVQTSNQTTITNDGVQTSNHSIRIDKDGGAATAHPLFMKIVFADKLCKF